MLMIDICCGLKGASQMMTARGWNVVTLDIDPRFSPAIVADVRDWHWAGSPVDLLWMSPPCDEFAREWMPWSKTGRAPDMSIVDACRRLVDEIQPRYWVLENVRGAVPYLGTPRAIVGPFYFWGNFPAIGKPSMAGFRKKESYSSTQAAERAAIPRGISLAFALACERQSVLIDAYADRELTL